MLNALGSIVSAISIAVQFLISFITGLINLFSLIAKASAFLVVAIAHLPAVVLVFGSALISLCVVFLILGR